MRFIGGLIFRVFSNAVALLAAAYFVQGFIFSGNFVDLLVAAAIFTVANTLLQPILKLLLGPLILLTFGLFIIIINAVILYVLDIFTEPLIIEGYLPLLLATLIIGIVNILINFSAKFFYRK